MSDNRYKKLYSLPGQLYAVNAPVVIEAGALLKDTQTDRVIAQLKIKNVSIRTIKAVTVQVAPFNVTGQTLGAAIVYQYLDLEAGRDKSFGNKTAIRMPEPTTRSFTVRVSQVVYADGSMWEDSGAEWKRFPTPRTLEDALEDKELAKQFQIEFGEQCKFWPAKASGLWYCTCGAINLATEKKCHKCGLVLADLADADFDELENQRDRRIAKERKVAKRKTNIKIAISVTLVIALVILAAVAYITQSFIPGRRYKEAVELFNAGKYDEAIAAFEKLGDYKDSAEQIKAVEQAKQEAREDEIDSLIEETKENIAPYIEVLSQETNGLELEVTQEFVDNIGSVNIMGYTGTVSHGASDMVNTIDIMEWVCNDTSTENEFIEFTELLERYYGKAPEIREAEGISDNTYFWVDHDNLCMVMAWYADSCIHTRWDFVPDIVTPTLSANTGFDGVYECLISESDHSVILIDGNYMTSYAFTESIEEAQGGTTIEMQLTEYNGEQALTDGREVTYWSGTNLVSEKTYYVLAYSENGQRCVRCTTVDTSSATEFSVRDYNETTAYPYEVLRNQARKQFDDAGPYKKIDK